MLMPPLSISEDELRRLVAITAEAIAAATRSVVPTAALSAWRPAETALWAEPCRSIAF